MDDSRKPGSGTPPSDPWSNDMDSEDDLGATGVFRAPAPSQKPGASASPGDDKSTGQPMPPTPKPVPAPQAPAEPVVHKVVLGGGAATTRIDLLDLLRKAAPAPADLGSTATPGPALAPGMPSSGPGSSSGSSSGSPSEGFTQLLRALPRQPAASPPTMIGRQADDSKPAAASDTGFTSLLRAMEPSKSAPSPEPGGFTELLQRGAPPAAPVQPSAAMPAARSAEPAPGDFTRLISTLGPKPSRPTEPDSGPAQPPRSIPSPSSSEPSSMTQFLSRLEQPSIEQDRAQPLTAKSARPAAGEDLWKPYDAPTSAPFSPATPIAQQKPQMSESAGGEITQYLQILERPSVAQKPDPPVAAPPVSSEGSSWTQTYNKLDEPVTPARPTLPAPEWTVRQPVPQPGTSPPSSTGPGEYTRIITQSEMREMQLRRASTPATPGNPPGAAQPQSAPPGAPQFQWPQPPQAPQLPHQFAPPAMQPPHYTPPGGMPPQFGGGAMQPPQYAPPAMPQMPAPAPPAMPTPPTTGKMQQYLPLLLITIIFLLVVILVTMVFLLK